MNTHPSTTIPASPTDSAIGAKGPPWTGEPRARAEAATPAPLPSAGGGMDPMPSRDEFFAIVTHELRSPLNAMRGWAHVMGRAGSLNALQTKALEAIDRGISTQARFIDQLLDSQRMLSGKLELQKSQGNLSILMDDAIQCLQDLISNRRIQLEVQHAVDAATVFADLNRLAQVLFNAMSYVIKIAPEDGMVSVRTSQDAQRVAIDIASHAGPGLESSTPHENSTAPHPNVSAGMSFSLSLAQQVVQLHGGRIELLHAKRGAGTKITILLPAT